jgi:hypothetical protein
VKEGSLFSNFCFLDENEKQYCGPKMDLLALLLTRTGLHFLSPSSVIIRNNFLQPGHTTQPTSHPMHINPEDGGSMFLRNIGIHLQDYTQQEYHNLIKPLPYF